jgi:hypothetical protein
MMILVLVVFVPHKSYLMLNKLLIVNLGFYKKNMENSN